MKSYIFSVMRLLILCGVFACTTKVSQTAAPESIKPEAVFATWQQDPATTMTIDWHVLDSASDPVLEYKKESDAEWQSKKGDTRPFPFTDRIIHRVELTGLEPDSRYLFRLSDASEVYCFQTMPAHLSRPICFLEGGDVVHKGFEKMTYVAAGYHPDFIVLGGDLSYTNGDPKNFGKWYQFLDVFQDAFKGDNNRIVPIVMAIGNHEVWQGGDSEEEAEENLKKYGLKKGDSPYYNALLAFPGQPEYGVLDFGDYLSWLILDSNHRNQVVGTQTEWLKKQFEMRKEKPYLLASYHVPAYPSVRPYDGITSREIRENWIPLFDQYGLDVAFEHHDHTYKRTFPLKGNEKNPDGIVYLGDGDWGKPSRELIEERWYLEKAFSQKHVIVGTLDSLGLSFQMVNENGDKIDEYQLPKH